MRTSNSTLPTAVERPNGGLRNRAFVLGALAFLGLAALPACAAPQLVLLDATDGGPIEKLRLGDDLRVAIAGGAPTTVYQVRLLDAADQLVSSRTVTTDSNGALTPVLLWQRTGVVGCDPGAAPNPSAWLFERYEDAEARDDEELSVVLKKVATGNTEATAPLRVIADTTAPRFYISDADACPRFLHEEEDPRWIAGLHLETYAGQVRRLWILDADDPASAILSDLRPQHPNGQSFVVPNSWEGVTLAPVADPPAFYFFWASIEPPPPIDPDPEFDDRPTCLTYPTRTLPNGTQTTPVPICPPCIGN